MLEECLARLPILPMNQLLLCEHIKQSCAVDEAPVDSGQGLAIAVAACWCCCCGELGQLSTSSFALFYVSVQFVLHTLYQF